VSIGGADVLAGWIGDVIGGGRDWVRGVAWGPGGKRVTGSFGECAPSGTGRAGDALSQNSPSMSHSRPRRARIQPVRSTSIRHGLGENGTGLAA
jgi:hypothetical protein